MNKVMELRQERAAKLDESTRMLAQAELDSREMTADESARWDTLRLDIARIDRDIEAAESKQERLKAMPVHPAATVPGDGSPRRGYPVHQGSERTAEIDRRGPYIGATFAEMFNGVVSDSGFDTFDEFALIAAAGLSDPRIRAETMGVGGASGVHYMIPTEHAVQLFDRAMAESAFLPRVQVVPMQAPSRTVAGFSHRHGNQGAYADATHEGLGGKWTSMGETISKSTARVRAMTLNAHKLADIVELPSEVLEDGAELGPTLQLAMIRSLSWTLDHAIAAGTGVGQPLGILNSGAAVEVSPEAEQAADSLLYQNLSKMLSRLTPSAFMRSAWIANPTVLPQLLGMIIPVEDGAGNIVGGSHYRVLTEENGEYRMLSRPIYFSEALPEVGERGDIILADLSEYMLGMRSDVTIARSDQLGFQEDTVYFRSRMRADGRPVPAEPYVPKNGDNLSEFVILGERS